MTKNFHPRIYAWELWPKHTLHAGTERYLFSIDRGAEDIAGKLAGAFTNAITGAVILPKIVTGKLGEADLARNGVSVHPWLFAAEAEGEIRLGPGVVALKQDLHIGARQSLHVAPGTTLRLGPDVSIVSRGRVTFAGTATSPVTVERLDPAKVWGAIVIHGETANDSEIHHANVSGGSWATANNIRYSGMISVHWSDDIRIENTRIGSNTLSDDALHIVSSRFVLDNVQFADCFADCIDLDYATGSINRLTINKSYNDGLDLMTSNVSLASSVIAASGDKAISIGEKSSLDIDGLSIRASTIGLAVKDRSTVMLDNARLAGNGTAIDIYKKNWRFDAPGSIRIKRTHFADNQVNVRVENGGSVTFVGQTRPDRVVGDGKVEQVALPAGS